MKKVVKCYYAAQPNYGDLLTPVILQHYSALIDPQLQFECVGIDAQPHLIGIGSILSNVPRDYSQYIWTTGNARPLETKSCPDAKLVAVRGTASLASIHRASSESKVTLGDGALLMSDVYPLPVKKEYKLGLIPHVIDYATVKQCNLAKAQGVLLIDLRQDVALVTAQIKSCHCILASSLHGLIVADAFQIPNHRFLVSTSIGIIGGDYKFADYYSAFGLALPPILRLDQATTLDRVEQFFAQHPYHRPHQKDIQEQLRNATVEMLTTMSQSIAPQPVATLQNRRRRLNTPTHRRRLSRPRR